MKFYSKMKRYIRHGGLKKGYHKIKVTYFDGGGGNELNVLWSLEEGNDMMLSADLLFH